MTITPHGSIERPGIACFQRETDDLPRHEEAQRAIWRHAAPRILHGRPPLHWVMLAMALLFPQFAHAQQKATPAPPRAQRAEPSAVDPVTGTVHSRRLTEGMPLGGVGAGTFQIMTDGAISRATLEGNVDRPTGDLPGCFAAIRTTVSGHTRAQVLALHSAYSLPTSSRVDFTGLTPQARLDYHDADLPITTSVLAFSPLVPFVLKDASYPAAVFVFRLRNPLPVTAEVSVVLSWESPLGIGSDGHGNVRSDRTGITAATIPSDQGYFGVGFAAPNRHVIAGGASGAAASPGAHVGEMVLMTYPQMPEATVTTAAWNAQDSRPGWWDGFERTGLVSGTAPPGAEGVIHPAGAVAVRIMLKPNDVADLPFAVAWYLPHTPGPHGEEVGRYYQNLFADAGDVARHALADWTSLYALTEEWQERLTFSNLPHLVVKRLIDAVAPLMTRTLVARDGRFVFLSMHGDESDSAAIHARLAVDALLLSFYPRLAAQSLMQQVTVYAQEGGLPAALGLAALGPPISKPTSTESLATTLHPAPAPFADIAFVLEAAQATLWTGDQDLLAKLLPAVRGALEDLLRARDSAGLPTLGASVLRPGDVTLWLAGLRAGEMLADRAQWRDLAGSCRDAAARGAAALEARAWNGRCYGAFQAGASVPDTLTDCDPEQLLGQWAADQLDLGPLLPPKHLAQALHAVLQSPPDAAADSSVGFGSATLAGAVLAIRRDAPTEGVRRLQAQAEGKLASGETVASDDAGYGTGAAWNAIYGLTGFEYDAQTARLALLPNLPGAMRLLTCPVFAPTFWATLEYKPTVHGGVLGLRIDRLIDPASVGFKGLDLGSAGLTLHTLRVPGAPPGSDTPAGSETHVSVGRRPIGFKSVREASGDLLITFDTPLILTTGDRLQIEVH